jgi:PAS domain S-box-containing protein
MSAHAEVTRKHTARNYGLAVAAVVVALGLRLLLEPLTGTGARFALSFLALLLISLFVGPGPGLLTLALSIPLTAWLAVVRDDTPVSETVFQTLLAAADGFIILYAASLVWRRRESLDVANRDLRRDVTEQRLIDDQRQLFVSLLDNSVDFIGIADPHGKAIYLNAAGRRMIGLAPDFPIEQLRILDCYPPDLRSFATDVLLKTMVEKGVWSGETFFQNLRTHERIPVSDTHFMIRDASGTRVLGMGTVTRDVTQERRIADERERLLASEQLARHAAETANVHLREVEDALRRAVAARDDVLRIVVHDLRNPLSVIMMEAQILEHPELITVPRDSPPSQMILRSARRMNQLIEDLLDVVAVEAGELRVDHKRLSAAAVAREAVESQTNIAAAAKIAIRLEAEPGLRDVWGDHERLLQVFENLIGNAIKFSEPGGGIIVRATPDHDHIVFSVADTGCGIDAESLRHVFDRFWQAKTHAKHLGAGLGLPVTKGIVEAHGGRIWVESAPGRGSTFYFTIPMSAEDDGRA